MALQLHPNVQPLFGNAQVVARGRNPVLMCGVNHTLHSYNAWMATLPNFGPNNEPGIFEEDVLLFLGNAVRPGQGALDAAGVAPGTFTHSLDAVFLERCWQRLLADGFDASVSRQAAQPRAACAQC